MIITTKRSRGLALALQLHAFYQAMDFERMTVYSSGGEYRGLMEYRFAMPNGFFHFNARQEIRQLSLKIARGLISNK